LFIFYILLSLACFVQAQDQGDSKSLRGTSLAYS